MTSVKVRVLMSHLTKRDVHHGLRKLALFRAEVARNIVRGIRHQGGSRMIL